MVNSAAARASSGPTSKIIRPGGNVVSICCGCLGATAGLPSSADASPQGTAGQASSATRRAAYRFPQQKLVGSQRGRKLLTSRHPRRIQQTRGVVVVWQSSYGRFWRCWETHFCLPGADRNVWPTGQGRPGGPTVPDNLSRRLGGFFLPQTVQRPHIALIDAREEVAEAIVRNFCFGWNRPARWDVYQGRGIAPSHRIARQCRSAPRARPAGQRQTRVSKPARSGRLRDTDGRLRAGFHSHLSHADG